MISGSAVKAELQLGPTTTEPNWQITSIDDMLSSQIRPDGQYDVVCKSGKFEVASAQDLQLNNVCPKRIVDNSLDILSIQRRTDGKFGVICRDTTRRIVSREEILNATACKSIRSPVLTGRYITDDPGPFCRNYWINKIQIDGPDRFRFRLSCSRDQIGFLFACEKKNCRQNGGQRIILLIDNRLGRLKYKTYGVWTELRYAPIPNPIFNRIH